MPTYLNRRQLLAAGISAWATAGLAAPKPYDLVPEASTIGFKFKLSGADQTGTVPVKTADIRIDPGNLAVSRALVTADIREARTGLIFITQALLSESVLDATHHPIVQFKSTGIRLGKQGRISEGARIDGELTLRGITKPVSLNAMLSRPPGSAPEDLSVLYVQLDGSISRAAFGATGYPDLVDDNVTLDIRAEMRVRR